MADTVGGTVDPGILEYGILPPDPEDYESPEAYTAAYNAWLSGFEAYLNRKRAEEAAQIEAARQAMEEAAQAALETAPSEPVRGEEIRPVPGAAQPDYLPVPEDRYAVGSYVDAAGNVWSADGELLSQAEDPTLMEAQPQTVNEPVTGDPTIDTALLLLDLMDALTGEEGMSSDVDGIQEAVEGIQHALEHPLMTTSFQDYTVTEGLLLLLLLSVFMAACAKMLKEGFAWLR